MNSFNELQNKLREMDSCTQHNGYYYKISDALTIMICGMLCSLQNISDICEWANAAPVQDFLLREFKIYKRPSRAQLYNLISCVNREKFNIIFVEWVQSILKSSINGKTVAIDGKTIRSTDKLSDSPLHIVSAVMSENNLVLGSLPCDTKISEPPAFRELIKILDINGAIVVADALHCKKESAKAVVEEGGDYLFVVKDNEPTLRSDIELYVKNEETEKCIETVKTGGRIERRTAYVSSDIEWLQGKENWKKLSTIGAIHTEFIKDGVTSSMWHYYICSKELNAKELLKHARLEWAVESMHWLLDVHYQEDKTRVRDMNVQQVLNIMRKIALNLAREYKTVYEPRKAMSAILKRNLYDINNLMEFIGFIDSDLDVTGLLLN